MKLSEATLTQVRELVTLSRHYQTMNQSIQASLIKVVQDETGVDLSRGDWNLDQDTGELTHVTAD